MEKPIIKIKSIIKSLDENFLTLKISIFNPENRTLYAYAVVRRVLYDSISKELTLCLNDSHIDEKSLLSMKLKEPKILELEANLTTTMTLKVHKILKRLKSHKEIDGIERIEILNIYEASKINVEIAFNENPFYYNPKENNATQLKTWGKSICKFSQKIDIKPNDIDKKK